METTTTQMRKLKRQMAEQLYITNDMSIADCARIVGVSEQTIYRWIADEQWNVKKMESQALEAQIEYNIKRALVKGLKAYIDDPENKSLQGLVSLLKQVQAQQNPTAAYKEHILAFLDKTTGFFLSKGYTEVADAFKANVVELAEFIIPRR